MAPVIFSGTKEKWLPLYHELKAMTQQALGTFEERETQAAVVWKKHTSFAEIAAKKDCLVIAFARTSECDDMSPVKIIRTSKNRVVHYYEAADRVNFPWFVEQIGEAYLLTGQDKKTAVKRREPLPDFSTIDEYIALFAWDTQKIMQNVRAAIRTAVPCAVEKISWNMPTFYNNGNIMHFAAAKSHLGIYPGAEALVHFKNKISDYESTKGAIRFPFAKPVPCDLIAEIAVWANARLNETKPKKPPIRKN
jgi:uncharacterized protein YdhG (YjbR/CyaY superfamily)